MYIISLFYIFILLNVVSQETSCAESPEKEKIKSLQRLIQKQEKLIQRQEMHIQRQEMHIQKREKDFPEYVLVINELLAAVNGTQSKGSKIPSIRDISKSTLKATEDRKTLLAQEIVIRGLQERLIASRGCCQSEESIVDFLRWLSAEANREAAILSQAQPPSQQNFPGRIIRGPRAKIHPSAS